MLLIIIALTTVLARNYRQALARVIELKLRADDLLVLLRVEKQAAEAARREAEVANRAKTQFFTAASHDLRQPLHAMGLFAEALRQRVHEPEVAHLVNSINDSVDALEGLFSELLDITRIDSGGVEVHPQAFEVADILRKLRLHFEPTAFEKGLALRLRGGAAWCTPTRCWSSASCATWSPTRSATPTTAACWSAARRAATGAAAGVGHRPGHPRRGAGRSSRSSTRCPTRRRWRRTSARAWGWAWRSSSAWPT